MSRSLTVPLAFLAGIVTVLAVAQDSAAPEERQSSNSAFSVSASDTTTVLLESKTGKTWILKRPASPGHFAAWMPILRLDDDRDVARWLERQQEMRAARETSPLDEMEAKIRKLEAADEIEDPVMLELLKERFEERKAKKR